MLNLEDTKRLEVFAKRVEFIAGDETWLVNFQPGNGTKYLFRMTKMVGPDEAEVIGCSDKAFLCSLQTGSEWIGLCLGGGPCAHMNYIEEKLGRRLKQDDLMAFTVLANILIPQCDTAYGEEVFLEWRRVWG